MPNFDECYKVLGIDPTAIRKNLIELLYLMQRDPKIPVVIDIWSENVIHTIANNLEVKLQTEDIQKIKDNLRKHCSGINTESIEYAIEQIKEKG